MRHTTETCRHTGSRKEGSREGTEAGGSQAGEGTEVAVDKSSSLWERLAIDRSFPHVFMCLCATGEAGVELARLAKKQTDKNAASCHQQSMGLSSGLRLE